MPYSVRRVRRICDVKGCRNTDCYSISKSRETGNSIIMCKECLGGGLEAIEKLQKNMPVPKAPEKSEPPELFFLGRKAKPKAKEEDEGKAKAKPSTSGKNSK